MGNAHIRESIRVDTLRKRDKLTNVERTLYSKHIVQNVLEWIEQSECWSLEAMMVYLSMRSEVETWELCDVLLKQGIQVISPVVDMESGKLIPRHIQNLKDDLVKHRYGMMEANQSCPVFPHDQIQLILVPGVAFDLAGNRLGYGKGFYDRFLPTCPNAVTAGLAFQIQIVKNLCPQPWDVPMQHVFTENGML